MGNKKVEDSVSIDVLIDLYTNKNLTAADIGTKLGFSQHAILRALKRIGVHVRTPNLVGQFIGKKLKKDIDEEQIKELYLIHKLTAQKIADKLNTSKRTILLRLKALGITRSSSEAIKLGQSSHEYRTRRSQLTLNQNLTCRSSWTKPEKKFANWCIENNIQFEHQFTINGINHRYDFFACDKIIEIDGDYWHSLPKQIIKDKVFTEEAIKRGYTVVRFKESEINESNCECFRRILCMS